MKLFLADTATSVCSFAIADDGVILAEEACSGGPSTAARLVPAFQRLLAASGMRADDLDGLAVTAGPGSFTGLRVGMAFVKGLAYALDKRIAPLSSLEVLAMNAQGSNLPVCPMFDARRNEVYYGLYSFCGERETLIPDAAAAPADFLGKLEGDIFFLGDGALHYRHVIQDSLGTRAVFAGPELDHPRAAAGLPLALAAFAAGLAVVPSALTPIYLRLSEAELARKG
jgi:tRNA threonylcarbamoyladenosine biosynthesis protein TsaB